VTIGALVVVGLALAALGVGIITLVRDQMVGAVEASTTTQARGVATLAEAARLPPVLEVDSLDRTLLQVVAADGQVLASSGQLTGLGPITGSLPAPHQQTARTVRIVLPGEEPRDYRVVGVPVDTPTGPVVAYAAGSLADASHSLAVLTSLMAGGLGLALVVIGAVTWFVAGRALRPVDAIRAEVDRISSSDLERRVPVPSTGDEITRLATTMNRMLDRLESAAEQQRQLVADVSHDIRSPLASVRTQLEVALAHPGLTDWPDVAEGLLEDVDRLQQLATDLLLLARLDSGEHLATQPVDLADLVRSVLARRPAGRVPVKVALAEDVVAAGSRTHLARVVGNLLDNAERHADTAVSVTVLAGADAPTGDRPGATPGPSRPGGRREAGPAAYGLIEVCNDGPPIPERDRERVFHRFVRLDEARAQDAGGTGLGLSIARDIARAHGGDLIVVERPAGACFVLAVPAGSGPGQSTRPRSR
jgi:signal transduction histidine kinase